MMERTFTGVLMLDWKTGKAKLYQKTKPKAVGPYNIPVKFEIVVVMPERKEIVGKGRIVLSDEKVTDIMFSDA